MAIKNLLLFSILAYGIGAVVILVLSLLPVFLATRCAFGLLNATGNGDALSKPAAARPDAAVR